MWLPTREDVGGAPRQGSRIRLNAGGARGGGGLHPRTLVAFET